jgi:hypothetical protein
VHEVRGTKQPPGIGAPGVDAEAGQVHHVVLGAAGWSRVVGSCGEGCRRSGRVADPFRMPRSA